MALKNMVLKSLTKDGFFDIIFTLDKGIPRRKGFKRIRTLMASLN